MENGKELATIITQRVIDGEVLPPLPEVITDEWFLEVDQAIKLSSSLAEGFRLVFATQLARVQSVWDDLSLSIRKQYDLDFKNYATSRAPNYSWSTIDNWIRAARTYVIEAKLPFKTVEVPERDELGHPVYENGKVLTREEKVNPYRIPISKLVVARSLADKGQLDANPQVLEKLVDDYYSVEDLRAEIFSPRSKEVGIDLELRFKLVGPTLLAARNGDEVVLVDDDGFNWLSYYDEDREDHELVKLALDRLMRCLNIVTLKKDNEEL